MTSILSTERDLYESIWASAPNYSDHAPGEQFLPLFLQMIPLRAGTVIDAGAGSGKGALALRRAGFNVAMLDVTDAGLIPEARTLPFIRGCLWHPLQESAHYVYCCDVLEHLPPQFTMLAIHRMLEACLIGLFLTISLVPDEFGVWVGRPLHQSVFPFVWWRDALTEVGELVEARDLMATGIFYVRPR